MTEYEISCLGKKRFYNRRLAKRRAGLIRRTGGPAFKVYPCFFCGQFHLGHPPGQATYLRHGIHGSIPLQELPQ